MIEKLKNLIKELADKSGFDEKRIWVGENSYGEYEIEIDQEVRVTAIPLKKQKILYAVSLRESAYATIQLSSQTEST